MRRRRARCSLRGCPRSGAVLELRATRRARAGGAPLQMHARAVVQVCGRRRGLRRRPRLFSGPPCQTDRMRERRRVLSVRSASSGRSSGAGENRRRPEFFRARAGVRYDYSFCQSREQRNTAFPGALYLHRELLSNRCISSLIETAAETHSFARIAQTKSLSLLPRYDKAAP